MLGGNRDVDGLGRALLEGEGQLGANLAVGGVVQLISLGEPVGDDAFGEVPRA